MEFLEKIITVRKADKNSKSLGVWGEEGIGEGLFDEVEHF